MIIYEHERSTRVEHFDNGLGRVKFIGVYGCKNWFGKPTICYLVLDGKTICAVWHEKLMSGYISANLPDCLDVKEAVWLLDRHPSSVFKRI